MLKFKQLIMSCINEDIAGTNIEKLDEVRRIFEIEKIYNGIVPSQKIVQDWLQGLCSVEIPFEYHEILQWYEVVLGRDIKESEQCSLLDKYWINAGKTLFNMLYNNY